MVDYGIDYIESRVAKKTDQIDKHRMNKYILYIYIVNNMDKPDAKDKTTS